MMNPFDDSPSGVKLKAAKLFRNVTESARNPARKLVNEPTLWNCGKCDSCQISIPLSTEMLSDGIEVSQLAENDFLFRPLLLADCCSLYSISRVQPNAQERCSRIILAHLRDLQALLAISFVDASVNIGDAGAKHGGNTALLYDFSIQEDSQFRLSDDRRRFARRKMSEEFDPQ